MHCRHVEVIFCDDIREEVGNKHSYIGVYSGELNVSAQTPSTPVLLPKLCLAVRVATDKLDPFESLEVRLIKVIRDEESELLSTGQIPITKVDTTDATTTRLAVHMNFMLAPFQIDEDMVLRVKAITEREELLGMGLKIKLTPPDI